MKKIINKNTILGLIVGIIVSGVTAYAVSTAATDITFKAKNKNWKVGNVADALDSLYISKTSDNYSTDEKVIGTWIDGKPIYQKTLDLTTNNNDSQSYSHGISNVEKIYIDIGNSFFYNDEGTSPSISVGFNRGLVGSHTCYIQSVNTTDIIIRAGSDCIYRNAIVTLKYTKTTDNASN